MPFAYLEYFGYICHMNQRLQDKIAQYKRAARGDRSPSVKGEASAVRADGLSKVIRSKKDADIFMAELKSAVKRAAK
jgi:hypothetical protein